MFWEKFNLDEPIALMKMMEEIGVELVNFSAASPYYNPHLTRPAYYPPQDGYLPPEDPIVGVARQIQVAAELKAAAPNLLQLVPVTAIFRNGSRMLLRQ